jgi:hypothetical protein
MVDDGGPCPDAVAMAEPACLLLPCRRPSRSGDGPRGSHLVAADGEQLLRAAGGSGLIEVWDPRTRTWADAHRDQPVADLLAAAPMLVAECDEARTVAQRLWEALPAESQGQLDPPDWLTAEPDRRT